MKLPSPAIFLAFATASAAPQTFVTLERRADGFTLVQDGKTFASMGATTVIPSDPPPADKKDRRGYDGLGVNGGDLSRWATATAARMRSWGMNTLGAWAHESIRKDSDLLYTHMLSFGWAKNVKGNRLVDVWSPAYAEGIEAAAVKEVVPLANDRRLLGWFTNNELPWHGEHGWVTDPNKSLLELYFALPPDAAGRREVLRFLRSHFRDDFSEFSQVFDAAGATDWAGVEKAAALTPRRFRAAQRVRFAWMGHVAEKYFALCEAAIRRHDKNHLILGCRFAGSAPVDVLSAQARHCDVLSLNRYDRNGVVPVDMLDRVFALTEKPILITEFGWRATENRSDNKNTRGVDVTVPTQKDRAARARGYISGMMKRPYLLGMHWFQHHDEPPAGRFDGEDSNYGLVDIQDRPYEELTGALTTLNREIMSPAWKRDAFVFPPKGPKGWPENEPLPITGGSLKTPVNLLPTADNPKAISTTCDAAGGSRVSAKPAPNGGWIFSFQNAEGGWGVAPGLHLPDARLAGATRLKIRLTLPKDAPCRLLLTEAGANRPDHVGRNGADGESFDGESFTGTGAGQTLTIFLEDCSVRWEYGNQQGNRRLDLDGLENIGFAIPTHGLKGELVLSAFTAEP